MMIWLDNDKQFLSYLYELKWPGRPAARPNDREPRSLISFVGSSVEHLITRARQVVLAFLSDCLIP
jgi:hypothetical protein